MDDNSFARSENLVQRSTTEVSRARLVDPSRENRVVWLDITDFIQYAEGGNVTVSGIQRVIANLVIHSKLSAHEVVPVILERDAEALYAVDSNLIDDLISLLQSGGAERAVVIASEQKVRASKYLVEAHAGDVFVMAGAFWIYNNYDFFATLRNRGVKLALFIHDLIQLSHPEYVSSHANRQFRKALLDVLSIVTLILTNSNFVRDDVKRFINQRLGLDLPVKAVQLPTELPDQSVQSGTVPDAVRAIVSHEYVLCVTTIEIRKNHIVLLKIWERLLKEQRLTVPNLVFVGKWGWHIDDLKSYMDASGAINKWLFVLNDLSDAGLNYLYDKSLFTVYPSFAEGWGLPVGESLSHGKPCVASSATSIPEVGGDFARYFDPYCADEGYQIILSLLRNRSDLAAWAARIRRNFKPKTWLRYCTEFYQAIDTHLAAKERWSSLGNFGFSSGQLYVFGNTDLGRLDDGGKLLVSARMSRGAGWHAVEDWGVWASDRVAILEMQTDLVEGADVRIYLHLRAPPGKHPARVVVESGGGASPIGALVEKPVLVAVRGLIGAGGVLSVTIVTTSDPDELSLGRNFYAGISAIGFCPIENLTARVDLLEASAIMLNQVDSSIDSSGKACNNFIEDRYASGLFVVRLISGGASKSGTELTLWARIFNALDLRAARMAASNRRWRIAERRYARLLQRGWALPNYWIQYGHVLKEQGEYHLALTAYIAASSLDPGNRELSQHIDFCRNMDNEL